MPGPMKKPTALKKLQGTYRPDRAPENEPIPLPQDDLSPPDYVIGKEAIECWNDLAPKLHAAGLFTEIDGLMLGQYCMAFQTWKRVGRQIANEEIPPNSPGVWQYNKSVETMMKIAPHFGLSPATRAKISVPQKVPDKPTIPFRKRK